MAEVNVALPTILHSCADGKCELKISGDTLSQCVDQLLDDYPLLTVHLFAEGRELRRHVNAFFNGKNLRWLESWDIPVQEGDHIDILQAVSGG